MLFIFLIGSVLFHLLFFSVLTRFNRSFAAFVEKKAVQTAESIKFNFVDIPEEEEEVESDSEVFSDRDRVARSPEKPLNEEEREESQPRIEGNIEEFIIREEDRINTEREEPDPSPRREETVAEGWERSRLDDSNEEIEEEETISEQERKRKAILEELASLSTFEVPKKFDSKGIGDYLDGSVSFDTKGFDLGPWADRIQRIVRRNWVIPIAARSLGIGGVTTLKFKIMLNGKVEEMEVASSSGNVALDESSVNAILSSNPFPPPPVPETFPEDHIGVTWSFYYNTRRR
jgi:TonB family protein